MLNFFQRIFGSAKQSTARVIPVAHAVAEPAAAMPSVEVARLRLAAILERLPDELKPLVLAMPESSVTVALPVSTILKQLPHGAVKVSLATLHRQAPAGVLGPLPPGDKRVVDVPLAEVFRHLNPQLLKRRGDQRAADGHASEFNLFGNAQQPYQLAPTVPDEVFHEPAAALPPPPTAPVQTLPDDFPAEEPPPITSAPRIIAPPPELFPQRVVKPASAPIAPPPAAAPQFTLASSADSSIALPLGPLSGAWPAEIRDELAALNGSAEVALPKAQVTAGLARGRVTFTWGQIRGWLRPALPEPSASDAAIELTLPLKIVAPVFLGSAKRHAPPKPPGFESDIPALFNDRRPSAAKAEIPAVTALVEPASVPTLVVEKPKRSPTTVGDLFGQPEKTEWTPAEIVAQLALRPGISGAVVALQEGLLVAHSLPADVKSEIIAAFLPQIFARLNQYSGEMKLGEVDDLLFTTHGAHCQIYRLGFVYFAVLGKPGEPLPWTELRLVADELARQSQPKP